MRSLLIAAAAITLGCADGPSNPEPYTPPLVTGVFDLISISGESVPTTLVNNAMQTYVVFDETYILRDDYTFTRTQAYRVTTYLTETVTTGTLTQHGTFAADAGSITFSGSVSGGAYTNLALRNGDAFRITFAQTQQTLLYRRR